MEIVRFLGSMLLLYVLVQCAGSINRATVQKYGYAPISVTTVLLTMTPYALVISVLAIMEESPFSALGLLLLCVPAMLGLFHAIRVRTSAMTALVASVFLLTTGVLMVAVFPLMREREESVLGTQY